MSLVGHCSNCGVAGDDVCAIFKADIKGIDNHQGVDIPIGRVGGVDTTQKSPVIVILHNCVLLGKGASIHSSCQLNAY
jgi:hypothetical protein